MGLYYCVFTPQLTLNGTAIIDKGNGVRITAGSEVSVPVPPAAIIAVHSDTGRVLGIGLQAGEQIADNGIGRGNGNSFMVADKVCAILIEVFGQTISQDVGVGTTTSNPLYNGSGVKRIDNIHSRHAHTFGRVVVRTEYNIDLVIFVRSQCEVIESIAIATHVVRDFHRIGRSAARL